MCVKVITLYRVVMYRQRFYVLRKEFNYVRLRALLFLKSNRGVYYVTTNTVNNCVAATFRSLYYRNFRVSLSLLLGKELLIENKTRPKVPRKINVQHKSQ